MEYHIETLCVHNKPELKKEHSYGSISMPIYQTSTYAHPGVGKSTGYDYVRESNPTRTELENTITALEKCYDSVACSSGMAAMTIALELIEYGSHAICSEDLYGGSVRLFSNQGSVNRGMSFSYVDTNDEKAVRAAINEKTKLIYVETPSNPTMQVTNLAKIRDIAKENKLMIMVDNTFLSPYFQNPFDFGADIVIHSGTKFLGGHNDVLAGFLCVGNKELADKMRYVYKTIGPCLSPFDSYLMSRGIKTLALRMEKQQENAVKIANWLKMHKKVKEVYYIGLEEHPGYEINKKQSRGFGSMISFKVDTADTARNALERVKLIQYAESLGGTESLMTYPMLQTHADVPEEIREKLGITDTFLRFSVGIENVNDLIADLEQALE